MDDGAFKVTVENSSDVNEMEEQPDDEESRYWFGCRLHCIVVVGFRVFAGEEAARAPAVGDDCVRKRLSGMMDDHDSDRSLLLGLRIRQKGRNKGTMDSVIFRRCMRLFY